MPFTLTNAPVTFQWLMETCLGDLNLNWCFIYLDDIIIFSKDLAIHLAGGHYQETGTGWAKAQTFQV